MTQRELAARLGITEQGAGQIASEMVRDGFLARRVDAEDARARRLELGPRGRELLRLAGRFHAAYERRLARQLGAPVAETRRVLEHIVATSGAETAKGRLRPA